ncbi:hypothetical protein ECZU03_33270 [Escherichia coli]|nr:hypothetical protein ECZU03_33270 [Escherichia coli]
MCTGDKQPSGAVVDTRLAGAGAGSGRGAAAGAARIPGDRGDGFGRTLAFHRAAEGDVAGAVTG